MIITMNVCNKHMLSSVYNDAVAIQKRHPFLSQIRVKFILTIATIKKYFAFHVFFFYQIVIAFVMQITNSNLLDLL